MEISVVFYCESRQYPSMWRTGNSISDNYETMNAIAVHLRPSFCGATASNTENNFADDEFSKSFNRVVVNMLN